jgi:hypothetical protein
MIRSLRSLGRDSFRIVIGKPARHTMDCAPDREVGAFLDHEGRHKRGRWRVLLLGSEPSRRSPSVITTSLPVGSPNFFLDWTQTSHAGRANFISPCSSRKFFNQHPPA